MASIHVRTAQNGQRTWQVKWREATGQRSRACPTQAAAKRVRAIVEAHGTYVEIDRAADVPTFTEWAEHHFSHATRANADTTADYRKLLALHIAPALGELPLTAITADVIRRWVRDGLAEMADKTRRNVFSLASGILGTAVEAGHIDANPCRSVRLPRTDAPKTKALLTPGDLRLILEEIPERHRPLIVTLAGTGMRWGEATALTVGDVDLLADPPVAHVVRAVKHRARRDDAPGRPKTERGTRDVALPAAVVDVLTPLVMRPAADLLFPNTRGHRIGNSTFHTSVWQPALDRACDEKRHGPAALAHRPRIHDLRAFATTWMIDGGVPIDVVADQLGHESIETTFGIYRRVNKANARKAADAMQRVLAGDPLMPDDLPAQRDTGQRQEAR